jgi:hypothetical protein
MSERFAVFLARSCDACSVPRQGSGFAGRPVADAVRDRPTDRPTDRTDGRTDRKTYIAQGWLVTDPDALADVGAVPPGEAVVEIPEDVLKMYQRNQ